MSDAPIRIWLEIAHHAAFRVGGWAFVSEVAGEVSGTVGGDRRIDAERTALAALAAALAQPAAGAGVELYTASPLLLALPARIAAAPAGETPPTENRDLWAQATTAPRRPGLVLRRAEPARRSPTTFATAWADLARDRAKEKGAFSAAIPKPNLAAAGL